MNSKNSNIVIKALGLAARIVYPRSNARKVFAILGILPMVTTFALLFAYVYLDLPKTVIDNVWTVNYLTYAYTALVTAIKCATLYRHGNRLEWLDRFAMFGLSFLIAALAVAGFVAWTFCQ